jgi:membrane-associated phospholipid phosphatase
MANYFETIQRSNLMLKKQVFITTLFLLLSASLFPYSGLMDANKADQSQINDFDKLLINPYSIQMDKLGTYFSAVSILTPSLLILTQSDKWFSIGTMYLETIALAYGLKELGKYCINRPRPYMYFDNFPLEDMDDWYKSFPSGHTTLSFAGATFTSYIFSKYYADSKWKIPAIGLSYSVAFATAGLRIASGSHFMTDVIVGAITGAACGFFVPWIHSVNNNNFEVQVKPSGIALLIKY